LLCQRFIFKVSIASLRFVVIQVLLFVIGLGTLFCNFVFHIINTCPQNFFEGSFDLDFFRTYSPDPSERSLLLRQQSLQPNDYLFIPLDLRVLLPGNRSSTGSIEVGVSYEVEAVSGGGRPRVIKIDGVGSGLRPETPGGRAAWDLLVHLLYISSGLTYSSLGMISGLRRQLVCPSGVSDIHGLQSI
jgi:hypothetical protein